MDIIALDADFLEAIDQAASMVQKGMDDDTCAQGKCEEVRHSIGGREVKRRIGVVSRLVEAILLRQHTCDIVHLAEPVIRLVCGDGEVCKVPRLQRTLIRMRILKRGVREREDDIRLCSRGLASISKRTTRSPGKREPLPTMELCILL